MKNALIIVHNFPPYGDVGGSIRTVKFVKYLPNFLWKPIILSVKRGQPYKDDKFFNQINGKAELFYTKDYIPFFLLQIMNKVKKFINPKSEKINAQIKKNNSSRHYFQNLFLMTAKLFKHILSVPIFIPDIAILWLIKAYKQAVIIVKSRKIDVIFSTSPPHSTHLIGLILRAKYNIPWVVEFRDQWADNPASYSKSNCKLEKLLNKILERIVVKKAKVVISATQSGTKSLSNKYKNTKSNFITITNGFDPEDFEYNVGKYPDDLKQNKMIFTHVGVISAGRDPSFFLRSIYEIICENPTISKNLEVRFVGDFKCDIEFWQNELPGILVCTGQIDHSSAIKEMFKADVLLIFQPSCVGSEFAIPGKLYEYIATGNPILAMTSQGPSKDFIDTHRLGITVDYTDIKGIKEAILKLYSDWNQKTLHKYKNDELINKYNRKNLTENLVDVFNKLTLTKT